MSSFFSCSFIAVSTRPPGSDRIYHERELRPQTGRFYQAYETLGLIYLNLSLLILSIEGVHHLGNAGFWIAVVSAVSIAEIVAERIIESGENMFVEIDARAGITSFRLP